MEHGLPVLLQFAEQLHVQTLPDACSIEIESTPSAVGTLVGVAVDGVVVDGAAVRVGLPHALKPHIHPPATDSFRAHHCVGDGVAEHVPNSFAVSS
jgi:hypothetical protein